ncbi:MAG TPA: hypothetical protein VFG15_22540 [Amycolatopsis sp.]|nr:hypothetical protein [Amycolatopsis sp.]
MWRQVRQAPDVVLRSRRCRVVTFARADPKPVIDFSIAALHFALPLAMTVTFSPPSGPAATGRSIGS